MSKPLIAITNCTTGEEIIREMNDEEYAHYLADIVDEEARQAEENASE